MAIASQRKLHKPSLAISFAVKFWLAFDSVALEFDEEELSAEFEFSVTAKVSVLLMFAVILLLAFIFAFAVLLAFRFALTLLFAATVGEGLGDTVGDTDELGEGVGVAAVPAITMSMQI